MNCPSRTDEPFDAGYNQNPPHLSADLTTTADLNGIVNTRALRRISHELQPEEILSYHVSIHEPDPVDNPEKEKGIAEVSEDTNEECTTTEASDHLAAVHVNENSNGDDSANSSLQRHSGTTREKFSKFFKGPNHSGDGHGPSTGITVTRFNEGTNAPSESPSGRNFVQKVLQTLIKYSKFIGPGFMVSVAYIDPGNYSTDIAAGASYRFKLLFIVLMSNLIAVFLQSLAIKLGTVTGLNLAENCRAHCPKWLNISLYLLAEIAIIATDIAEVIGTAIALNLLNSKIPLVAGCAISILDVLLILLFYSPGRPNGSIKGLQAFELFVGVLVLGVVVSFCLELSLIKHVSVGEVFRGYLPSSALVQSQGLYQACGILGATVMPHSLYLGSGLVQARLAAFDIKNGYYTCAPPAAGPRTSVSTAVDDDHEESNTKAPYKPSLAAIKFCLKYSVIELAISLFTFALFVNSAILIVAGASLSDIPSASSADIFDIHALLSTSLAPAAGIVFALALLLSGISAGVVCTIAGQMVSEGALNWSMAPWVRRLVTRSISITPSIIIAGAVGRDGLDAALNGTQVVLSVVLPFVSAPLIWFTCCGKYMTVEDPSSACAANSGLVITATDEERNGHDHEEGAEVPGEWQSETDGENENASRTGDEAPNTASGGALEAGSQNHGDGQGHGEGVIQMRNHWVTTVFAVLIWLVIAVMNIANLALLHDQ